VAIKGWREAVYPGINILHSLLSLLDKIAAPGGVSAIARRPCFRAGFVIPHTAKNL